VGEVGWRTGGRGIAGIALEDVFGEKSRLVPQVEHSYGRAGQGLNGIRLIIRVSFFFSLLPLLFFPDSLE